MKTQFLTICALLSFLLPLTAEEKQSEETKIIITNTDEAKLIGGSHFLSLQWIDNEDIFGRVEITPSKGSNETAWKISGRQDNQNNNDYLTIEGKITEINERSFVFSGEIVSKISHINAGIPFVRNGRMNFHRKGSRKYWRLQEMENDSDSSGNVIDYVDIYLLKYRK